MGGRAHRVVLVDHDGLAVLLAVCIERHFALDGGVAGKDGDVGCGERVMLALERREGIAVVTQSDERIAALDVIG